ncbi:hypothetical protein AAFF_G00101560, partial [Aldrovandia affinis]
MSQDHVFKAFFKHFTSAQTGRFFKTKGRGRKQYKQYLYYMDVEVPYRMLAQKRKMGAGADDVGEHQAGLPPGAKRPSRNPSSIEPWNVSAAGDTAVGIGEHQAAQDQGTERPNPDPSQNGSAAGDTAVGIGEHQAAQDQGTERPNPDPSQDGDDLLYPGAHITKGQSLLLLMSYVLRHNLTGIALDHLLQIFNEHFPGLVPATSYLFHKSYGQYGEYEPHFYCHQCSNYIGTKYCGLVHCGLCQSAFDVNISLKNGSYFLVVNVSSQMKEILEKPNIQISRDVSTPGFISDIQCGGEYRKLKDSGEIGKNDISLLWNCDGIPVFKSSKCQIWPIQCQIIELEPADRKNNICVPCLWFGESKPNIQTLLIPFVKQLQELQ